ncbi:hypothetical protein D3C72_1527660 [compost metagenome]
MQLGGCLKNVRTALGQFRGYADGKALLRRRHGARRQQFSLQAARRFGQQQAQGVDQLRLAFLQGGQACFNRSHLRTGLGHVQCRGDTIAQPHLRQAQTMARDLKVFLRHGQGTLHRTQLNVIARRLGQQRQQHAPTVILGDLHYRVGGFDLPPDPPPQIQLPTGRQIPLPQVEG